MLKNLKQLRAAKGISQQKLAGILGISQQSINKYENHNVEPDIATLIALANYFETSIDYLVGRQTDTARIHGDDLSRLESNLINDFRKLNTSQKDCVYNVIKHIGNHSE